MKNILKRNTNLKIVSEIAVLLFLFLSFSYSCNDGNKNEPLDDSKQLLSFKFEAALNPVLNGRDIEGEIKNNTINLTVPEGVDLSQIIAAFSYDGVAIYVGGKKQVSGETVNNFSSTVVYTLEAEDKSSVQYTVQIKRITLSDKKQLNGFKFESALNSALQGKDIEGKIENSSIYLNIPEGFIINNLIASFTYEGANVLIGTKSQVSGVTSTNFDQSVAYIIVAEDGSKQEYPVVIERFALIPHIYINTEGNEPIKSKDDYVNTTIKIVANGWGDDYEGKEFKDRVKGRGNSTWGLPKKPYRLKLDKKASILGLATEKDWVLLANYLDPTLMLNATAFKIGQLLDLQYTNHAVPVDLTINGEYKGSYQLTEQVEISESRVNISDKTGVLLELDTNFDEDYKFYSPNIGLPVMVKDPDITSDEQFQKIKTEFIAFENTIASTNFPNNNWKDYIDIQSLVKYLIVYNLTLNMEINHPKSTYMYKEETGKYFMGPIWDFDWGFDYEGKGVHFGSYTTVLFKELWTGAAGYKFFPQFLQDSEVKKLYKQTWQDFKANKFNQLIEYINDYAYFLTDSKKKDYEIWKTGNSIIIRNESNKLKNWLNGRAQYMDSYIQTLQ